jgi:hypothetical protein
MPLYVQRQCRRVIPHFSPHMVAPQLHDPPATVETRRSLDAWVAMGAALRARVPLVVDEEAGVYMYHMAAEGRHGHSPGFQRVGAANGDILSLEAAVQGPFLLHYLSRLPNHPH